MIDFRWSNPVDLSNLDINRKYMYFAHIIGELVFVNVRGLIHDLNRIQRF